MVERSQSASSLLPALKPGALHVWRVDLDNRSSATNSGTILSTDELERAARFVREIDRQRYIAGHTALRMILAGYLGVLPGSLRIDQESGGKPRLKGPAGPPPLYFNLSHSQSLQLVAVTLDREVGVDVEWIRPLADAGDIVERFFTSAERAAWNALGQQDRLPAFFRCWTRKEAFMKARGLGLSLGLDQVEVSFVDTAAEPRIVWCGDLSDAPARWKIYDVATGGSYLAACAVEVGADQPRLLDWPLNPPTGA